ncbi:shikimate kinase [Cohnella sp. CFH 77786]|uniref:shikimate kinase n=1 Tax=Cohnella sp. CFH 77786 TaxID=2662265 RepID=UPI001C6108F4|nr:shikimate kinase [Cohnella sp. CFH 77786]MBW5447093.1 shikimate kinase [Cohnella sp. CFH 77786]
MPDTNIVLTGFMGCGKTTVGRLLADNLSREFVDADHEIERRHGKPVTEIFATLGEPEFRRLEREFIVDLCRGSREKIVSLGGGAFMQEEVRRACLSTSIVVFLEIGWESWIQRHHLLIEGRPILQNKSPEEVKALFDARQAAYRLSHCTVRTDGLTPEAVADRIVRFAMTAGKR